jgi:hypothetical protein
MFGKPNWFSNVVERFHNRNYAQNEPISSLGNSDSVFKNVALFANVFFFLVRFIILFDED